MRSRLGLLALGLVILAGPLVGAYTYDSTTNGGAWVWNGDPDTWGSRLWGGTVTGNAADYEVNTSLSIYQAGGVVMQMLRASSANLIPGYGSGSYISVEFNLATWPGTVTMSVKQSVNATTTVLGASSVTLPYGGASVVRTLISGNTLTVRLNGLVVGSYTVSLTSGYAGNGWQYGGTASASAGSEVGHKDTIVPSQVNSNVALSLNSSRIGLRWQASNDDTNGTGVQRYEVRRGGTLIGNVEQNATTLAMPTIFYDQTAVAGTTYSYGITAVDYHGNLSTQTNVSVTAPPATFPDARRTGVRPEGAYWGGGGEQIDLLSGNLNYSLPVGTAMLRAGGKVPVSLTYNSQNWWQENGVNWQVGSDIGYGFGWKVQIGSITPYYVNWTLGVDHYRFTDGSGAEYRLDVNNSGVWSST